MADRVRLVLAFHNHQPVGNFEGVFQAAFHDSYAPFLQVLRRYPRIPISLHTSGCLMEWLVEHHPEYVAQLRELCERGQIEVLGGGFYEPILTMIPGRDRIGQIRFYTAYLERLLPCRVRGMWVPERVWEPTLVSDLAQAGIEYTILDDFHFLAAGLEPDELYGCFLSEDDGRLIRIFPGSEKLRYTIPFAEPQETIEYLQEIGRKQPDALVVLGDDGEKFGTWPGTHKHVYKDGWLKRFFDLLMDNRDWLHISTLANAVDSVPPQGKIYLPTASYREMTEWALPAGKLAEFEQLKHDLEDRPDGPAIRGYLRGGFWRNFKVKYPESSEMYARMLEVSNRLAGLEANEATENGSPGNGTGDAGPDPQQLSTARDELYRGQCNCAYWHGAFGGLYLPHLRNAVYTHLIAADNALEAATRPEGANWVEVASDDYDLDARQEVRLANDQLVAYVAPARGGLLYELDLRDLGHNLLATLNRRPEAYHRRVVEAASRQGNQADVKSIHDLVQFKQKDLDKKLRYDRHPRKSLVDHLFRDEPLSSEVVAGTAPQIGGPPGEGVFEARLRRRRGGVQLVMRRELTQVGQRLASASESRPRSREAPCPTLLKTLRLSAGASSLEVEYVLENLPLDDELHLAIEMNFAGIPAGAPDRYFTADGARLGQVEAELDLRQIDRVGLVDEWLGLSVALRFTRPAGIWTFPIQTVSQSESGFELVHQSTAVLPHWTVRPDPQGRWQTGFTLHLDTTAAKARQEREPVAVG